MRAIAKEAGVSAASVVVHFKNKTALLEVALYEDIGRTIAQATASPPRKKDLLSGHPCDHIVRPVKHRGMYKMECVLSDLQGISGIDWQQIHSIPVMSLQPLLALDRSDHFGFWSMLEHLV